MASKVQINMILINILTSTTVSNYRICVFAYFQEKLFPGIFQNLSPEILKKNVGHAGKHLPEMHFCGT